MSKNQQQSDNKKKAKDGVEGQRKVVGGVISTQCNFVKFAVNMEKFGMKVTLQTRRHRAKRRVRR